MVFNTARRQIHTYVKEVDWVAHKGSCCRLEAIGGIRWWKGRSRSTDPFRFLTILDWVQSISKVARILSWRCWCG